MKSCAILGASGHGKVVAEIAQLNGYQNITFYDDRWPDLKSVEHWSVSGDTNALSAEVERYDLTVIAIGHNATRSIRQRELQEVGAKFSVIAHPSAVISRYATIGAGTVVMANAVINPFNTIGDSCIVNTGATIDHDCNLSDGVHISPGTNLAGGVIIGENSWIGIGSQIKQLVVIGAEVTVGAGSTVLYNIPDHQTVAGSPAQPIIGK